MVSMAQPDSDGPLPPNDFADRPLPLDEISAGSAFVRIHLSHFNPIHFGTSGNNRFDDPQQEYGVCYLAMTVEGAFAETCLRAVGAPYVALAFLEARSFAAIETTAPLRLVTVHGAGLSRLGATSVVTAGQHDLAQRWSRAIHDHPTAPDGILYRANHDNGEFCAALFERCRDRLRLSATNAIMSDRSRLASLLNRYGVGLG